MPSYYSSGLMLGDGTPLAMPAVDAAGALTSDGAGNLSWSSVVGGINESDDPVNLTGSWTFKNAATIFKNPAGGYSWHFKPSENDTLRIEANGVGIGGAIDANGFLTKRISFAPTINAAADSYIERSGSGLIKVSGGVNVTGELAFGDDSGSLTGDANGARLLGGGSGYVQQRASETHFAPAGTTRVILSSSGHFVTRNVVALAQDQIGFSASTSTAAGNTAETYFRRDSANVMGLVGDLVTTGTVKSTGFLIGSNTTALGFNASTLHIGANGSGGARFSDVKIYGNNGQHVHSSNSGLECLVGLKVSGGNVDLTNLPTADPAVAGRLWNDSGTVKISAG